MSGGMEGRMQDQIEGANLNNQQLLDELHRTQTELALSKQAESGLQEMYREARAEITRLEKLVPRWIPVAEQAPEPNKKVLLSYHNSLGNHRTVCGFYTPKFSRACNDHGDFEEGGEYDEAGDEYYWPEGWYEEIENWDDYGAVVIYGGAVTHWTPLPTPPTQEKGNG